MALKRQVSSLYPELLKGWLQYSSLGPSLANALVACIALGKACNEPIDYYETWEKISLTARLLVGSDPEPTKKALLALAAELHGVEHKALHFTLLLFDNSSGTLGGSPYFHAAYQALLPKLPADSCTEILPYLPDIKDILGNDKAPPLALETYTVLFARLKSSAPFVSMVEGLLQALTEDGERIWALKDLGSLSAMLPMLNATQQARLRSILQEQLLRLLQQNEIHVYSYAESRLLLTILSNQEFMQKIRTYAKDAHARDIFLHAWVIMTCQNLDAAWLTPFVELLNYIDATYSKLPYVLYGEQTVRLTLLQELLTLDPSRLTAAFAALRQLNFKPG